jgi:hypothetical protein
MFLGVELGVGVGEESKVEAVLVVDKLGVDPSSTSMPMPMAGRPMVDVFVVVAFQVKEDQLSTSTSAHRPINIIVS